jgi:hypothetical protein
MASNTSPLPSRREILRIETKLRDKLRPLANNMNAHWLDFCAKQPSLRATDIVPRAQDLLRGHGYYGRVGMESVRYHDLVYNLYRATWAGPLFPDATFEDELQNAVLTWNTCDNVVTGFWRHLNEVLPSKSSYLVPIVCMECFADASSLLAIPGFVKVKSKRAKIQPRIILFDYVDLPPGAERASRHNYIVITFEHDIKFVLDLSGYKFGLSRVLYTMSEYEDKALQTHENGVVVDVPALVKLVTEWAWLSSPGTFKGKWRRLMDFSFDSWA